MNIIEICLNKIKMISNGAYHLFRSLYFVNRKRKNQDIDERTHFDRSLLKSMKKFLEINKKTYEYIIFPFSNFREIEFNDTLTRIRVPFDLMVTKCIKVTFQEKSIYSLNLRRLIIGSCFNVSIPDSISNIVLNAIELYSIQKLNCDLSKLKAKKKITLKNLQLTSFPNITTHDKLYLDLQKNYITKIPKIDKFSEINMTNNDLIELSYKNTYTYNGVENETKNGCVFLDESSFSNQAQRVIDNKGLGGGIKAIITNSNSKKLFEKILNFIKNAGPNLQKKDIKNEFIPNSYYIEISNNLEKYLNFLEPGKKKEIIDLFQTAFDLEIKVKRDFKILL